MPYDDERVDVGGVDDRRGRRGAGIALGGGGLGAVGLLLVLLVQLLGGGDASGLVSDSTSAQGTSEGEASAIIREIYRSGLENLKRIFGCA